VELRRATGHAARTVPWLALGLLLTYGFTASGGLESGDASLRYQTARSWVDGRGGALPAALGWDAGAIASDGRVFSYFGPLQPALMVPFILAARALLPHAADPSLAETFFISLGLFPLLATAAMVLAYLALRQLGQAPRPALAATLAIGLASQFWHYARMGQEENLLGLALALWLYGAARLIAGRRWPAVWMAGGAAAALVTRWGSIPLLVVLLAASLWLLHRYAGAASYQAAGRAGGAPAPAPSGRPVATADLALGAGLSVAAVAAVLLYNWVRFGAWLENGYGLWYRHNHIHIFVGAGYADHLAALLVSPYRGLLIYSPIVLGAAAGLLATRRGSPERQLGSIGFAALGVVTLFFAGFHFWAGGHAWGPRFLTSPLVLLAPPLAALFARWPRSAVLVPALAALQIFSTMLPESTEEYVWYVLDHARPGYCNEWRAECTAVVQRIPRAMAAVANTVAGRPGLTLSGRPLVPPGVVLATSDYRTLYWWPVRIAFRLRALPLRLALLACLAGLAAAAAFLLAAWRSTLPPSTAMEIPPAGALETASTGATKTLPAD
jgi:hypothetical protein